MMRLLVVDDDHDGADALAELLRSMVGATVVVAYDGCDAVSAVAAGSAFDAMISDIEMPRMDGLAAALAIRRLPRAPPLLIAISGRAEALRERNDVAYDHVLAKPVRIGDLARLLEGAGS